MTVRFFVAGTPSTQGSKTGFVNHRTGRVVVTEGSSKEARERHRSWREAVAAEARNATEAHPGDWPVTGPVCVDLTFGLQKPPSAPKKRRWPTGARSGDIDKLTRSILDSLTGVLIADDAQVVGLSAVKTYGRPGVTVLLWQQVSEGSPWLPEWHSSPGAA